MKSKKTRKSIFVTGSNGFLGKHLVEQFLSEYDIFGINKTLDNKKPRYFPKKKNLLNLSNNDLPKQFSSIIHMAAATDVLWCQNNPVQCFKINVDVTQKLLEISRVKNCKFVYLSTSHVYGHPIHNSISESDPTHPQSIYAASKLAGEVLCESYAKSYGLDISIARLFSVYGPYSSRHLVTSRIMSQLEKNIINLGNIKSKRDFLYVSDAISAINIILKKSNGFNVYNVGTGIGTSIEQIFKIIKRLSDKKIKVQQQTNFIRKNDIKTLICDNSSLKKLGWKPKISLEDGLKQTLEWYHQK